MGSMSKGRSERLSPAFSELCEVDTRRNLHAAPQRTDVTKGVARERLGVGCRAVGGNHQAEPTHVSIVGGEQDTIVGSETRHDQGVNAEIAEQKVERRPIKGRVAGLEHEIVVVLGTKTVRHAPSRLVRLGACAYGRSKIRSPAAEIVIHIHEWHAARSGPSYQTFDTGCRSLGRPHDACRTVEIEGIDDVDEQQSRRDPRRRSH